ncbi:MAG: hypothetical protein M3Y25_00595 [Thermoproteota archaeon]|nr:hypothetical protein [Thermoproteota archaeon]
MGRWDENNNPSGYGNNPSGYGNNPSGYGNNPSGYGNNPNKKRNLLKLIRRVIFVGFVIVGVIVLYVYFSTSGLNLEIIQRGGPVETISVKLSNNNFYSINNVTVQFDNERAQELGNMGPFASIFITPESGSSNFKQVIVEANNGDIELIKNR